MLVRVIIVGPAVLLIIIIIIIVVLIIIRPRRYAQHKMRPIAIDVAWSVCVYVC